MGFGRFLFTATLPDIMSELSLSTTVAGWLASVNYIGYFIGALIAMFVPHRRTWQTLMVWAVISVVTTILLFIPNMSLSVWYVIRLFAGIASGVAMILSSTLVIQSFSATRQSTLSTLHYAGVGVGISASAVLTGALLSFGYHFDLIWLIAGLISLPLLGLLYAIRPADSLSSKSTRTTQPYSLIQTYVNFKRALYEAFVGNTKRIALLSISYGLAGFGYITSATFLPVMATQRLESPAAGLIIWLIVGVLAMLSNPIWGALAKRVGEIETLMGLTLLQAIGMLLPLWLGGAIGLYVNAAVLGMTFIGIVSMTLIIIKGIAPAYSNLLIGLATLAYAVGQFIGPLATIALARSQDDFNSGLMIAGVGLLIGLGLLVLFYKKSPRIKA